MLKIKDNVDLTVLEKLGFVFDTASGWWVKSLDNFSFYSSSVMVNANEIYFDKQRNYPFIGKKFSKTISDLLEAGVIEKVCDNA